VYADNYRRMTA